MQGISGMLLIINLHSKKNSLQATDKTTELKNIQKWSVTKLHGEYEYEMIYQSEVHQISTRIGTALIQACF